SLDPAGVLPGPRVTIGERQHAPVDRFRERRDREIGIDFESVDDGVQALAFEAHPAATAGVVVAGAGSSRHAHESGQPLAETARDQGDHALVRVRTGTSEPGSVGERDLHERSAGQARPAADADAAYLARASILQRPSRLIRA